MKKRFLPFLLLGCFSLLFSCNNPSEGEKDPSIIHDDDDDHDEDPVEEITEDEEEKEVDEDLKNISLKEKEIEVPSVFDEFSNNELSKDGGKYYLTGEYSTIKITAKKGSILYVFLDDVSIDAVDSIAFSSEKQVELHLILLNDSTNMITNTSSTDIEYNAFHVKGDVYISGSGTLSVTSASKNSIKVSKNLYVLDGVTINANAQNHSISAQSVSIYNANLILIANKDGINVETDGEISEFTTEQGYIRVENSNLNIICYGDGLQASTFVEISGGEINISCIGNFIGYSSELISSGEYSKDDFKFKKNGSKYTRVATDEIRSLSSSYYALEQSCKGIKVSGVEYKDESGNTYEVTSGDYDISIGHLATLNITSSDDCIHTNYGDVNLSSSNFTLESNDDGVHADYDLNVKNCSIVINDSYEGLEGANVTIDGENTNIFTNSSDDGINAASSYGTSHNIYINDGYIRVYASGDGLDANTSLNLNGGTVIVEGPGSNNGSLDAERVNINGGLIFACSTNGMQEKTTAKQNAFVYQGSSFASDSNITITDESKNSLFSYTLKQSCNQIIFSSSKLEIGSKYNIYKNDVLVTTISMTSSYTKVGGQSGPGGGGGDRPR